jgi:hypothetical protein
MTSILLVLAQATQVGTEEVKKGYGSLIFMGCFFLALIAAAIWWLKREA